MVTKIEVYKYNDNLELNTLLYELYLDGSGLNKIINIDGLSPIEMVLNSRHPADKNGDHIDSLKVGTRIIELTIIFDSDDVLTSRTELFRTFQTGVPIILVFYSTLRDVKIAGVVESNEAEYFGEEEGTTVTILCENPWFTNILTNSKYLGV